jgi:hypothetical protein
VGIQRSAASRDTLADCDEHAITVTPRKHEAAGVRAVPVSMQRGLEQMGALRTAAKSNTPVSKAIIIRVESASLAVAPGDGEMA